MTELQCTICQHTFSHDKFLFQLCGHGFCYTCTEHLSKKRKCATCRGEWGTQEPFRIYLDFPDQANDKSSQILNRLNTIDCETSFVFVEKAGDMIKNLVEEEEEESHTNNDKTEALLNAARRLEERLAPLMSELENAREKNEQLHRQLNTTKTQLKAKDALTDEINKLNRIIAERELALTVTKDELAHEKQRRNSEHEANRRLTRSLRKKLDEVAAKEKEAEKLKEEQAEREKKYALMKVKLRALSKLSRPLPMVQDPDDSLLVEEPLTGIENADIRKLLHKSRPSAPISQHPSRPSTSTSQYPSRPSTSTSQHPSISTAPLPKRRKTETQF